MIRKEQGIGHLFRCDTKQTAGIHNLDRRPRVGVLLSTYNGEQYLQEQIESIASQEGVDVVMFIRDDGSVDGTQDLLKRNAKTPVQAISEWNIEFGDNLGFLKSFEALLFKASGCDYYAFSDQDDVWDSRKLISAAVACKSYENSPVLYASTVSIADEHLNRIGENSFPKFVYGIPSELIRHRLAGHTMLWNSALQRNILNYSSSLTACWSHDQFVTITALLTGADLLLDNSPYVLHRRLDSSVTPGGGGILKRLRHETNLLMNQGRKANRKLLAKEILELSDKYISDEDQRFLSLCTQSQSVFHRVMLLKCRAFNCGLFWGNAEAMLSVLLGRF